MKFMRQIIKHMWKDYKRKHNILDKLKTKSKLTNILE